AEQDHGMDQADRDQVAQQPPHRQSVWNRRRAFGEYLQPPPLLVHVFPRFGRASALSGRLILDSHREAILPQGDHRSDDARGDPFERTLPVGPLWGMLHAFAAAAIASWNSPRILSPAFVRHSATRPS